MFTTAKDAVTFTYAGRATLTLRSVKSGVSFTFRVSEPPKNPNDILFVSVLCDSGEQRYIGMLDGDRQFRTTKKTNMSLDGIAAKAFSYYITHLNKDRIADNLQVTHTGRCGACARKIITPASQVSGIGPECTAKMGIDVYKIPAATPARYCDHAKCSYPLISSDDQSLHGVRQCNACGDICARGGKFRAPGLRFQAQLDAAQSAQHAKIAVAMRSPTALQDALSDFMRFEGCLSSQDR